MYQESGCFDPNAMMEQGTGAGEDCLLPQMVSESEAVMSASATHTHNTFALENLPCSYFSGEDAANAIATWSCTLPMVQYQQNPYNNNINTHFVEVVNHGSCHHQQLPYPTPTPTPDLLNLLHFPTTPTGNSFESPTNIPKPSSGPMGTAYSTNVSPFLHLDLEAPSQAALRELLPHMPPLRNEGHDHIQASGVASQDVSYVRKKRGAKRTNQFTSTTERQRRVDLTSKFDALKQLIPNPSKSDRASVVGDAIDYIRELIRTLNELKLLAEKKRVMMTMKHKVETHEGESKVKAIGDPDDGSYNESLRSSWVQRKSKDTEVDVRIVDNEVTIKLVQRKKIDCLVHVSQVLDQLNLDLQHVAGGHIGDFCSYLFNTKICEGSSVYASAIANKLIEVMDTSLAAT